MSNLFSLLISTHKRLLLTSCKNTRTIVRPFTTPTSDSGKSPIPPVRKAPADGKGKGPITWKSLAVAGVFGCGALAFMYYVRAEKEQGRILLIYFGKSLIQGYF